MFGFSKKFRSLILFLLFMGAYFSLDRWLKQQVVNSEPQYSVEELRAGCSQRLVGKNLSALANLRNLSNRETVSTSVGVGMSKYWISISSSEIYPGGSVCTVRYEGGTIKKVIWHASQSGRVIDPR